MKRATQTDPALAVLVLLLTFALLGAMESPVLGAPGDLDPTFGTGGKVTTQSGAFDLAGQRVALQPDGRIVVAGVSFVATQPNSGDFVLIRYNPDGSLDSSFGNGGVVFTDFAGDDGALAVAIQPDGRIVAAGYCNGLNTANFALARYNRNGSLDSSFDGDGKVITDFDGNDGAAGVATQRDGRIVAVGKSSTGDGTLSATANFAVARYNPNGSLDSSFDGDGKVTTDFGSYDSAADVAIEPDGRIVVAGISGVFTGAANFALACYNRDGSLDSSFGAGGKVLTDFGGDEGAGGVVIQPDGRIVAAGSSSVATQPNSGNFALARYHRDGSLDTSFDGDGKVLTDFGGNDTAIDVAIQPDGSIVAAGESRPGSLGDFALARYNPNGSLDTSFGTGGKVTTDFGANEAAIGVAIQPDGRIVASGFRINSSTGPIDFALARYLAR